jgi:hypothetical protein
MQLNENINAHKLNQIKEGDLMVILTDLGKALHFKVINVYGNEVIIQSENKAFKIFKNTAIQDDWVTINDKSQRKPIKFVEIRIKNDERVISILGNEEGGQEEEEEEEEIKDDPNKLSGDEKRELIKKIIAQERKKINSELRKVEPQDTFAFHYGDPIEDDEGLNTGEYEYDTTAVFEAYVNDKTGGLIARLLQVTGSKSGDLKKYTGKYFTFMFNSQLFEFLDDRIAVLCYIRTEGSDSPIPIEFVYHLDLDNPQPGPEDEEDEGEDDFGSTGERSNKPLNKDLIKLVHHKSFSDRLFGREGKGIDPLNDIRSRLGLSKRGSRHVKFLINKEIKIDAGKNIHLEKGNEITGKMVNDERIIIYGRNGRAEIHLFLKNTKEPQVFNVKAVYVDKHGKKEDKGLAKIKIID